MRIDSLSDLPQQYQEQVRKQVPDLELTRPEAVQRKRRNQRVEWAEQCAYFDQADVAIRQGLDGADCIYAIQNENAAGPKVGSDRKKAGRRPGVPDIMVAVPAGGYHGLYLEMKQPAGTPSDVSAEQREWHERLRNRGYRVGVCYGWREAWALTTAYLGWSEMDDGVDRAKAKVRRLGLNDE